MSVTNINDSRFFEGQNFKFHEFAKYLTEKYKGAIINGAICIFNGKIYEPLSKDAFNTLVYKEIPTLTIQQTKETYAKFNAICGLNMLEPLPDYYIPVKNGIFNMQTMELESFSPDKHVMSTIATEYHSDASSKLLEDFIQQVSDDIPEIEQLLYEMIAYTLWPTNELETAFYLYSEGANGKSTVMSLIRTMIGDDLTTSVPVTDLGSKFSKAHMYGSHVNFTDDVDVKAVINNTGALKSLISGERINAQYKYGQPFDYITRAKLIMAGNDLFMTNDDTHGFFRRMIIVPLTRVFGTSQHKRDTKLFNKLSQPAVTEALLKKALYVLHEIIEKGEITEPPLSLLYKQQHRKDNSPIMQFIDDDIENEKPDFLGRQTKTAYANYKRWCSEYNFKAENINNFGKKVKSLGYQTAVIKDNITKRPLRYYVRSDVSTDIYNSKGQLMKRYTPN